MVKFLHHFVVTLLVLFPLSGALTLQTIQNGPHHSEKESKICKRRIAEYDDSVKLSWNDPKCRADFMNCWLDKQKPRTNSKYIDRAPLTPAAFMKQQDANRRGIRLPKHPGLKYGCGKCGTTRKTDKTLAAFITEDGSECHMGTTEAVELSRKRHAQRPVGRVEYEEIKMYYDCTCWDLDPNYAPQHNGFCFEGSCNKETWKCGNTWFKSNEYTIDPRMEGWGMTEKRASTLDPGDGKHKSDDELMKEMEKDKKEPLSCRKDRFGCKEFNPGLTDDCKYGSKKENGEARPRNNPAKSQHVDDSKADYYADPAQCKDLHVKPFDMKLFDC